MKRVTIILEVLILVGLTGCGKGKEKTVVGKWEQVDGDQTLEFSRDGIVTLIEKGGTRLGGDYEFINENEIKMSFPLFGTVVARLSSSRNEITLTNPFGKIEKYRRSQDRTGVKKAKAQVHQKRISGRYVNQSDSGEYLELRSDGTFVSSKPPYGFGREFVGEWRMATIISFVFRSHRGEPTEHDSIEGEIVGDKLLVEGFTFGRWWNNLPRKNITPWIKKGNAPLIKTINQDSNIWSMYSNEDWLFEFQLKKDRTFSISAKGIWDINRDIVSLRDTARDGKTFIAEIDEYDTLVFITCLRGTVLEKQNGAYLIEETEEKDTLWSRYVRGEQNIVLELDKSGSFQMTGSGMWMTHIGLICEDNYRQWRAIVRDDTLIDSSHQTWVKQ